MLQISHHFVQVLGAYWYVVCLLSLDML